MNLFRVGIFVILMVNSLKTNAEKTFHFINYNVSNGLSQNSVHCIYQDQNDNIWMGTQDGLNKFDGKRFKAYKYNPTDTHTLSDHFVLSIAEDQQSNIWVGTGHGLNLLNKRNGNIQRYYLNPQEREKIQAVYPILLENSQKEILIPHHRQLTIVSHGNSDKFQKTNSSSANYLAIDKEDNIWGIGEDMRLTVALKSNDYSVLKLDTIPSFLIKTKSKLNCTIDHNNILWLYKNENSEYIFLYDIKRRVWLNNTIKVNFDINHINITRDGTAWISSQNGVYLYKHYKFEQHIIHQAYNKNTLVPGNILCSYEDRHGNIWVGSSNAGLSVYNPLFDNFHLFSSGIENNTVFGSIELGKEKWLATASGLYIIDSNQNELKKTTKKIIFPGIKVNSIALDNRNQIWVSLHNIGLYVMDINGLILKKFEQNDSILSAKKILSLKTLNSGNIVVCTETGYYIFSSLSKWNSFYQTNIPSNKTGGYVMHAFEDDQKRLWLSKNYGIEVLDQQMKTIEQISSNQSTSPINRSIVTSCTQDGDGNIWIATLRSGIYQLKNHVLYQYTISNGLNSNLIYGIACDKSGRIWATTNSSMSVFIAKENRFYSISSSDGLPAVEFVMGSLRLRKDGKIIAGTSEGSLEIDANQFKFEFKKIHAQLSDVKIDGESVADIHAPLVIKPFFKTLGFEFSIKEVFQPEKIFYQYRLSGVDLKWNTITDEHLKITYTTLPYDKLTFQLRAASSMLDLDSAPIATYSFEVRPPYWKTIWFKILIGVMSIGLLFALIQFYISLKFKKQIEKLKLQRELQQERERISRDLHDNIGAYTSALIANIQNLKSNEGVYEERIGELNEYATNIMGYLRETIWVLNHEKLSLLNFADRFKNYASRIIKNYSSISLKYHVDINEEREMPPTLSLNLFRLLQEAFQNACKHSEATEIEIGIQCHLNKIVCYVLDNGKGYSNDMDNEHNGIRNMQARADIVGLEFKIQKESNGGTLVQFSEK